MAAAKSVGGSKQEVGGVGSGEALRSLRGYAGEGMMQEAHDWNYLSERFL